MGAQQMGVSATITTQGMHSAQHGSAFYKFSLQQVNNDVCYVHRNIVRFCGGESRKMSLELNYQSSARSDRIPKLIQRFNAKRLFDFIFAVLGLISLLPFLTILSLVMLICQGSPLFYRQQRVGRNGKLFNCFKFRSMVCNADAVLFDHIEMDEAAARDWAEKQKLENDPRITRLGHFLRRSSLDELPQLFNVLRGDMSLVGPRPVVPEELKRYGDHAKLYLTVRPGITGPWQIGGRNDCSYDDRVSLDAQYVRTRSFGGDIAILVKTAPAVWSQTGK